MAVTVHGLAPLEGETAFAFMVIKLRTAVDRGGLLEVLRYLASLIPDARFVTKPAVEISVLLGTQSVSTQAPPSPSRSTTVTDAPSRAATRAASYPPGPPPRTTTDVGCPITPPSNHRGERCCGH